MRKKAKVVPFRRKREGKTDYGKRLKYLAANKPRLVIRVTGKQLITQIIEYQPKGDMILLGLVSSALEKMGWKGSQKNLPAAYLTGYLLAKEAAKKKIKEAILDIGLRPSIKSGRIYACVAGALDGGLKINCAKEILPNQDRIQGKHIKPEIESMFKAVKEKLK